MIPAPRKTAAEIAAPLYPGLRSIRGYRTSRESSRAGILRT
jgi:hypothetical protein